MSDAVQAPGPAPIAPPAHVDLGPSPLRLFAVLFFGVGPLGLLLLVAAAMSGPGGAVLTVILFIPWLIVTGLFGVNFLKAFLGDDMVNYKRTRAAAREGRVGVSYFVCGCSASTARSSASTRSGSFNTTRAAAWTSWRSSSLPERTRSAASISAARRR